MMNFLVIGLGSDLRGDDAVGLVVARKLRDQAPSGVGVIEHHGEGTALISAWQDVDHVIVVDAITSGAETGSIYRFDALSAPLPTQLSTSSTHSFGLQDAVALSRQLDQLPKSLVVFGIEAKSFSMGTGLSQKMADAVGEVVAHILQEISEV